MACGVLTDGGTDYIYCVGGSAGGQTTATARVFRYNPVTDAIENLSSPWPGDADGITLPGGFTVLNNKFYILGGFRINTAMTDTIWEFTPSTNTWVLKKAVLPVSRGYIPTLAVYDFKVGTYLIYTGGGSDWDGTTLVDTNDSFRYDPVADSITTIASIPRATGETRAVLWELPKLPQEMLVMGGGRTPPNPSNEVDLYLPFGNGWSTSSFYVEGQPNDASAIQPWGDIRIVTPGFLPALGAPLIKGRQFTEQDDANAPQVVIVDEEMERRFLPNEDPIGKRITFNGPTDSVITWIQIVGVVGHTMHEGLDGERRLQVYFPHRQNGDRNMVFAVRTIGDPLAAMPGVRAALKTVDPDVALANISPMEELVSASTGPRRFSMVLLAIFSGLAAALAAIGLYGVMSYTVTQRSKELGVRLALGATPAGVQRLVMGQGMRLAIFGVGFGLVAALALTNLLRAFDNTATDKPAERLLFGVNANDPATFVSISLFLLGVTLLATWLPARRATSVDPVVALRDE